MPSPGSSRAVDDPGTRADGAVVAVEAHAHQGHRLGRLAARRRARARRPAAPAPPPPRGAPHPGAPRRESPWPRGPACVAVQPVRPPAPIRPAPHRPAPRCARCCASLPVAPQPGARWPGLTLRQRGPQFVALEPHEHVAGLDLRPLGDGNRQHTTGERAAQLDTRRGGHAARELQRAHRRRHACAERRHLGRACHPPGGKGGKQDDGEKRSGDEKATRHGDDSRPQAPRRSQSAGHVRRRTDTLGAQAQFEHGAVPRWARPSHGWPRPRPSRRPLPDGVSTKELR